MLRHESIVLFQFLILIYFWSSWVNQRRWNHSVL